jgi:hypothetical protein
MQGKRILSLDVALLMAGAKERGELEARVTSLIREVRKAGLSDLSSINGTLKHFFPFFILQIAPNFMQMMLFSLSMRFILLLGLELLEEEIRELVLISLIC